MKFDTVKDLEDEKFRRLTGVKRPTFDKMAGILNESIKSRKTTIPGGIQKSEFGKDGASIFNQNEEG